jgi:amino acid transporter
VNANGVQLRILVAQGVVISVIGLLYALVPTVSRSYWVFAALATEAYLIMYVLMFVAASNLRRRQSAQPRGYRAPALIPMCAVGVLASVAACLVGLLPPSQLGHVNAPVYVSALLAGVLLVGVLPPALLYRLRRPEWKTGPTAAG